MFSTKFMASLLETALKTAPHPVCQEMRAWPVPFSVWGLSAVLVTLGGGTLLIIAGKRSPRGTGKGKGNERKKETRGPQRESRGNMRNWELGKEVKIKRKEENVRAGWEKGVRKRRGKEDASRFGTDGLGRDTHASHRERSLKASPPEPLLCCRNLALQAWFPGSAWPGNLLKCSSSTPPPPSIRKAGEGTQQAVFSQAPQRSLTQVQFENRSCRAF